MSLLQDRCKTEIPFIIILESEFGFRFGGYTTNDSSIK